MQIVPGASNICQTKQKQTNLRMPSYFTGLLDRSRLNKPRFLNLQMKRARSYFVRLCILSSVDSSAARIKRLAHATHCIPVSLTKARMAMGKVYLNCCKPILAVLQIFLAQIKKHQEANAVPWSHIYGVTMKSAQRHENSSFL